jgi:hypothetical protein
MTTRTRHVLKPLLPALCTLTLLASCTTSGGVHSDSPQVQASVSLQLSNRPRLRLIPGFSVYYGPDLPNGYYFFGSHYWVFEHDAWHRARFYNGPWIRMPDHRVPDRLWRLPPPYRPPQHRPRKP